MRTDAIAYYRAIAPTLLPHLRRRPLSFKRYVDEAGDLFADSLTLKQKLFATAERGITGKTPRRESSNPAAWKSALQQNPPLPKPSSQSGRRLFLLTGTEMGNELWLDMRGRFKRWILRPDRTGGGKLIAMPAGDFAIDPAYRRAQVPEEWKGRVAIEDSGAYEVIEGSWQRGSYALWFNGKVLTGAWQLQKIEAGQAHRSWRLSPA